MNNLKRSMMRRCPLFVLAAAVVWSIGCSGGGAKTEVQGSITYKDKPVSGTIELQADGKKVAEAPITGGKYKIANPPKGTYQVVIRPMGVAAGVPGAGPGASPAVSSPPLGSGMPNIMSQTIDPPAKYSDARTSGLTLEVKGGKETQDFALTD